MKKKLKLIIYTIFLIIPLDLFASGNVVVNKSSMQMDVGKSETFNVSATNSAGKITFSSNSTSICTVSKSSEWLDNSSVTITVTGIQAGKCIINVGIDVATYDREEIKTNKSITVTINAPKSSNNNLSSIKIDGNPLVDFLSSKTNYDLGTKNVTSINIDGTVSDSKATLSGTGTKNLNYGKNNFNLIVTAENGSKKTYVISITRSDPRSTNNYLKDLTIDEGNINFNKNTTSYSIKVENKVKSITIKATPEDQKSTINGTGTFNLNDYNNDFNIVVKAENGNSKTYSIKVIRKDRNGNTSKLNSNTSLKSLVIEKYNILFDSNKKNYNLEIDQDVNELVINAIPEENTSKITIDGNNNLKVGINKINITVKAEDGSTSIYTIEVNKKGKQEIVDDTKNNDKNELIEKSEKQKNNNDEKKSNSTFLIILIIEIIEGICLIISIIYIIFLKKTNIFLAQSARNMVNKEE